MPVSARKRKVAAACAALATSLAGGAPAMAQTLTVTAQGTMPTTCTLTASGSFGTPNFATSGSVTAEAAVSCNAGFTINAGSANGAIINSTSAPSGFSNAVPYNFTLSVPLDNSATPASANCASSTLAQTGCVLSSGGKPSINKTATLTLAYAVPAAPTRLVAGSYSDTITLTIAAAQ